MKQANCEFCQTLFRYRSDLCRFRSWKTSAAVHVCVYCGVPADTIDHVPPSSVRATLLQAGVTRWRFVEVDACHECNSLLRADLPWTVTERKRKIKDELKRRYATYLRIPSWSDREIGEHTSTGLLGSHIREGLFIRDVILQRLEW